MKGANIIFFFSYWIIKEADKKLEIVLNLLFGSNIERFESFSDIVDPKGSIVNSPRWSRGNIMGPNRWAPKGFNHSMLFAPFGDVPSGWYWIPRLHRGLFTVSPFRTSSDTKTFKPDKYWNKNQQTNIWNSLFVSQPWYKRNSIVKQTESICETKGMQLWYALLCIPI